MVFLGGVSLSFFLRCAEPGPVGYLINGELCDENEREVASLVD
jgi:hypothetical protein